MNDNRKTKSELILELEALRIRCAKLEQAESHFERFNETLLEEDHRFRRFWDDLVDIAYEVDTHGNITYANRASEAVVGRPLDEILGNIFLSLFNEESKNLAFEVFKRTLNGESPEYELVFTNGKICQFKNCPLRDSHGNITGVLGIAKDITLQKQHEKELCEAHNKLEHLVEQRKKLLPEREEEIRAILETAPAIIMSLDRDGTIQYINHTQPGISREQLIGTSVYDYVAPESREQARGQIESVLRSGERVCFEVPAIGFDGETYWYINHTGPIWHDGQAIGVVCISHDITEQKKMIEDLSESENKFETIFNNISDGILLARIDTKQFVLANKAFSEMLRCNPEDIRRLGVADIHPEEDLPEIIEKFDKMAEGTITKVYDLRVKRTDGSIFHANVVAFNIILQEQTYLGGVFRDITHQKMIMNKLHNSEARVRAILDASTEPIFILNKQKEIIETNSIGAKKFGLEINELLGKEGVDKIKSRSPSYVYEKRMKNIEGVFESGKVTREEDERNGIFFDNNYYPVFNEEGKVCSVAVFAHDITKRKELERLYSDMAHAERLASLGVMIATIAHEFSQPLSVISLSVSNALADLSGLPQMDATANELKAVQIEISNIRSMLARIHSIARRPDRNEAVQVNLKMLVDRVLFVMAHEAKYKMVSIEQKNLDDLPLFHTNEDDIKQLLFCLLSNAIQAADGRGKWSITIDGKVVKSRTVEINVSDTCGGIKPEHMDRIFEPFFTTKPRGKGTGLGLPIVKRIVSDMGGEIHVESEWGKGSTFSISLPIDRQ